MTSKFQSTFKEFDKATSKHPEEITGQLGLSIGGRRQVEVANRPSFVYVRLRNTQNEVIQAFNNKVAPAYDLPIKVVREGTRYIVIGVDTQRYGSNWPSNAPFLPRHGNTHSFAPEVGGGGDVVFVYSKQFMPALTIPSGSSGAPNVVISPYTLRNLNGQWKYIGNTGTPNLTQYNPTGSSAVMILVYIDASTGNPQIIVNSGNYFSASITGANQIIPYLPVLNDPNKIPDSAIRLVSGTFVIGWDNIYDLRQYLPAVPTGTPSLLDIQDEGIPLGTVTVLNFVGPNVDASVSGSVGRIFVSGAVGGGGGVSQIGIMGWDEGVPLGTGTRLNVVGAGATLFISGTVLNLNIPLASGTKHVIVTSGIFPSETYLRFNAAQFLGSDTPGDNATDIILSADVAGNMYGPGAYGDGAGVDDIAVFQSVGATYSTLKGAGRKVTDLILNVQDEGVPKGTGTVLNFVGPNVDVSVSGTVARIFITGSVGGGIPEAPMDNNVYGRSSGTWVGISGSIPNYGTMYADDISQGVVIGITGTYYAITGSMSVGSGSSAFTFQNGYELKCNRAGIYRAIFGLSMSSSNNNEVLDGAVMVNDAEIHTSESSAEAINSGKAIHVGGSTILFLSVNDRIRLCVENDTAAHNITVSHANLTLVELTSSGGGAGISTGTMVQDEGVPQGLAGALNFVGPNIRASVSGSTARIESTLRWFNVVDYGAKGDDSTNDYTSINNALTALKAAGGGVLYFPFMSSGKYRIGSTIHCQTVANLVPILVYADEGVEIRPTSDIVAFQFTQDSDGTFGIPAYNGFTPAMAENIVVRPVTTGQSTAFRILDSYGVKLVHCLALGAKVGLLIESLNSWSEGWFLDQCNFNDCTTGIQFLKSGGTGSFHDGTMIGGHVRTATGGTGIKVGNGADLISCYFSCVIWPMGTNAIGIDFGGSGEHSIWEGTIDLAGVVYTPPIYALKIQSTATHLTEWDFSMKFYGIYGGGEEESGAVKNASSVAWIHSTIPFAAYSHTHTGTSVAVQDEGVAQGTVQTLNFVGPLVGASVVGGVGRIFISGSNSGKYRQFVYTVMSGTFSFVINVSGSPVMALEDLE